MATAKARTAQADSPCTAPGKVLDSSVVAPATVRLAMMVRPFEFEVDRELLSELERDDATWGARLVLQEGKVEGFAFHVFGVRPDTIAGRLGFENGDAVVAINRTPLMSLDQARQAYLSATRAQVIVVTVERQGTSLDLTYHLTQAPPAAK